MSESNFITRRQKQFSPFGRRSCADISFYPNCTSDCVEGCSCPKNQTLDANGNCVPILECPCSRYDVQYPAGYRELRPGDKLCTCQGYQSLLSFSLIYHYTIIFNYSLNLCNLGGIWKCQSAMSVDRRVYPTMNESALHCDTLKYLEKTACKPAQPRTCRNMQDYMNSTTDICSPGCICKKGYVLDTPEGECVKEQECPCFHAGRSHADGSFIKDKCNTCTCKAGMWNCTEDFCPG